MKHVLFRVVADLAFLPERLSMVRKFTNRLLPAITMIFCASPASAEIRTLARAGGWEAYVSVNEGGDLLCGILQFNDPYALMIKYSPINDVGFVHLRKA